eukprot:s1276_g19.t1
MDLGQAAGSESSIDLGHFTPCPESDEAVSTPASDKLGLVLGHFAFQAPPALGSPCEQGDGPQSRVQPATDCQHFVGHCQALSQGSSIVRLFVATLPAKSVTVRCSETGECCMNCRQLAAQWRQEHCLSGCRLTGCVFLACGGVQRSALCECGLVMSCSTLLEVIAKLDSWTRSAVQCSCQRRAPQDRSVWFASLGEHCLNLQHCRLRVSAPLQRHCGCQVVDGGAGDCQQGVKPCSAAGQ